MVPQRDHHDDHDEQMKAALEKQIQDASVELIDNRPPSPVATEPPSPAPRKKVALQG
jgi:hypothetical protein